MLTRNWYKWALALTGCVMAIEFTGCENAADAATAASSVITAGGVIYIISRIMQ